MIYTFTSHLYIWCFQLLIIFWCMLAAKYFFNVASLLFLIFHHCNRQRSDTQNVSWSQTRAHTDQWGWCWARCVVHPRHCSSGSGCWGTVGTWVPAGPGAPGCWRGTGSCQCCCSSDRRHPDSLQRTDRERKQNMEENQYLILCVI